MKNFVLFIILISLISCQKKSFDERVTEEIEKFNKQEAPKRLDPVSTLDSMTFDVGTHALTYHYTLEGVADDESVLTEDVKHEHRTALLKNLKGSIQLKPHKEQGLKFVYKYYSKKSGKVLIKESFTRKDYE